MHRYRLPPAALWLIALLSILLIGWSVHELSLSLSAATFPTS